MRQFEQHDPRNPLVEHHVLRVFNTPQSQDDYYFIKQHDHLLIYDERFHTYPASARGGRAGTTELLNSQFEMPLAGIRWFVDVIEQKFFKSPEDGGLPAHKLSYEEIVDGEDLHIMRSMGGGDRPGYAITNGSRRAHYDNSDLQEIEFSDRWLFQEGLMDYFKELADKYEQGQL